jgi:hypothetical protein
LAPGTGLVTYACNAPDGSPPYRVTVMFFPTDPPTLYAERGDSVSLMSLQPSGSGTTYRSRNETFQEHKEAIRVTWGYGASEMRCKKTL